ncbi:integrating conjugative element protein [Pseudomonas veronii]
MRLHPPLRIAAPSLFGLLCLATRGALADAPSLIVVEDRGGVSAWPYYQSLNCGHARTSRWPLPSPHLILHSNVSAKQTCCRFVPGRLSPGEEPRRVIQASGLRPMFLVGDDDRSRQWLRERDNPGELNAVGLVVNVASADALATLRGLVPGLTLSPVSGDDLAERLGLRHYPVLVTATGIEQ